ncbi:hypothetical protein SAMN05444362_1104 [Dysgonomonas macrotermitis]|uniref:Cyclic nucleotide-binding domain-containing protein n=2 Tax=Dysgonomonas macrotermitis TaxID=1346286 RepID=A0A1M5EDT6_9BACT|nr:hypothetical protein SAMN05444362_1104 [Dysgonomonas macrotermitis]
MTMKKKCLLLLGIFSFGISHAQVGINTQNPQGIFHIDPQADTSGTSGSGDDVVVKDNGYVGIGTVDPVSRIHIKTQGTATSPETGFILEDGNQSEGKILTAIDDTGLATWKELVVFDAVMFNRSTSSPNLNLETNPNFYATNSTITLSPGRWVVLVVMFITTRTATVTAYYGSDQFGVSATFSDPTLLANNGQPLNNIRTLDLEGFGVVSGQFWTGYYSGILTGSVIINNKSNADKVYYFMVGNIEYNGNSAPAGLYIGGPGGGWGEDNIVAYRIPREL